MGKKPAGIYQKAQINTASPGQRVVMVYNAITKNLRTALAALNSDDPAKYETFNNSVQLAQKLILELQLALDKEQGGEIAENLDSLYEFWREHLSNGNAEKDPKKIREVLLMSQELQDSWAEAEKKVRTPQSGKNEND
jgi:flagellar protein FliS